MAPTTIRGTTSTMDNLMTTTTTTMTTKMGGSRILAWKWRLKWRTWWTKMEIITWVKTWTVKIGTTTNKTMGTIKGPTTVGKRMMKCLLRCSTQWIYLRLRSSQINQQSNMVVRKIRVMTTNSISTTMKRTNTSSKATTTRLLSNFKTQLSEWICLN